MKFKEVNIIHKNYSTFELNWDYLEIEGSPSNFFVSIGVAETPYGPFQKIIELPIHTISYDYKKIPKKYLQLFFEVTLYSKLNGLQDTRTITYSISDNQYIQKLKNKYKLYLKSKVKNNFLVFKHKKFGRHCLECWDQSINRIKKDNCLTCYGTSYGNNHVYNLGNLTVDGFLKIGDTGYLELRKSGLSFESYPFINNQESDITGSFNKINKGDLFVIKDNHGHTIFSAPILDVASTAVYIDSKDVSILNNLQNVTFNIFHPEIQTKSVEIETKIVQINEFEFYIFDERLTNLEAHAIVFENANNDFLTQFIVEKFEKGFKFTADPLLDISSFRAASAMYFLDSDNAVVGYYPINKRFISYFMTSAFFETKLDDTLAIGDKIFLQFNYDGISSFLINSKTTRIAIDDSPKFSYLIFNVVDVLDNSIYKLTLDTSDVFDQIDTTGDISNFSMYRILRQAIYLESYSYKPCIALQRYELFLDETRTFKIFHKHVVQTGFRGSGVLLINLQTGLTYAAATYNADTNDYEDDGDFYFNPLTGEFDFLEVPEGHYELKFLYEIKDIYFDSFLLPKNPVFKSNKLISVDGWIYKNLKLKDLNLSSEHIFVIKNENDYRELIPVNLINDTLTLLPGDIDPDAFWSVQNLNSKISIDYLETGGYYDPISVGGTFRNTAPKVEDPVDVLGLRATNMPALLVESTVIFDNGDIVFDTATKKFYVIYSINMPIFKGHPIFQELNLSEKNWSEQDRLFNLLSRKMKFAN